MNLHDILEEISLRREAGKPEPLDNELEQAIEEFTSFNTIYHDLEESQIARIRDLIEQQKNRSYYIY